MPSVPRHVPVLMSDVLRILQPRPGNVMVDCTAGLGGHSAELLRRVAPGGRLLGIDLDPANLKLTREALAPLRIATDRHHSSFSTPILQRWTRYWLRRASNTPTAFLLILVLPVLRSTIQIGVFRIAGPDLWTCVWT